MRWHFSPRRPDGVNVSAFGRGRRGEAELSTVSLLAREVIQNSWDAFRDESMQRADELRIRFKFLALRGAKREAAIEALCLQDLAARQKDGETSQPSELPLAPSSFEALLNADELHLLIASDFGAPGLCSDLSDVDGSFYMALTQLNSTTKTAAQGGSFGIGKTAFIRASGFRILGAYTCFAPQQHSAESRRALGIGYFPDYNYAGQKLSGLGLLLDGEPDGSASWPILKDAAADVWAEALGLEPRRADRPGEWGLDLLMVEPQKVSPQGLIKSIEDYWWPAILADDLSIEVVDEEGSVLRPNPRMRADLAPFIETFLPLVDDEHSLVPGDARWSTSAIMVAGSDGRKRAIPSGACTVRAVEDGHGVNEASGASGVTQASDDEDSDLVEAVVPPVGHAVALIRGAHMVIAYQTEGLRLPSRRPFIQGTYYADVPQISTLLRQTEPGLHDRWKTKDDPDVPQEATDAARAVFKALRRHLRQVYDANVENQAPPTERVKVLTRVLKLLLGSSDGTTPPPPPGESLPVSVSREHWRLVAEGESLYAEGSVLVGRLSGSAQLGEVEVALSATIAEERERSGDPLGINWSNLPAGFTETGRCRARGTLPKSGRIQFDFRTDAYDPDWTVAINVEVS